MLWLSHPNLQVRKWRFTWPSPEPLVRTQAWDMLPVSCLCPSSFFPGVEGGVAKGQLPQGQRELLRAKQAVEIPDVKFTSVNFKQHLFKHGRSSLSKTCSRSHGGPEMEQAQSQLLRNLRSSRENKM